MRREAKGFTLIEAAILILIVVFVCGLVWVAFRFLPVAAVITILALLMLGAGYFVYVVALVGSVRGNLEQ